MRRCQNGSPINYSPSADRALASRTGSDTNTNGPWKHPGFSIHSIHHRTWACSTTSLLVFFCSVLLRCAIATASTFPAFFTNSAAFRFPVGWCWFCCFWLTFTGVFCKNVAKWRFWPKNDVKWRFRPKNDLKWRFLKKKWPETPFLPKNWFLAKNRHFRKTTLCNLWVFVVHPDPTQSLIYHKRNPSPFCKQGRIPLLPPFWSYIPFSSFWLFFSDKFLYQYNKQSYCS